MLKENQPQEFGAILGACFLYILEGQSRNQRNLLDDKIPRVKHSCNFELAKVCQSNSVTTDETALHAREYVLRKG